jgi:diguanylate cyclase (GGDEF)-like protein/putative nucleotidyltransferase with HDIG domain
VSVNSGLPVSLDDHVTSVSRQSEGAVGALVALSRLLATTTEGTADDIHATIVGEACECFGAERAVLLAQAPGRRLRVLGGDAPDALHQRDVSLDDYPQLAEMLDRRLRFARPDAERMRELAPLLDADTPRGPGLLLLLRSADRLDGVLVLTGLPEQPAADSEVAAAFADAGAAALDRLRTVEEHARQVRQQRALTRAAKSLNESLDLETVLGRICQEAVTVMDADIAAVYRGDAQSALVLSATHGLPPEAIGWRLPVGGGLAGKVVQQGRAMLTNDYHRIAGLPAGSPLPPGLDSAMGAPMEWDGAPRGVLSVGYLGSRTITQTDLALLETFAELAAAACANASAHAGLAHVARTDGLTGCLNHAALHDGLAKEIERAHRHDQPPLSLILIDLDDFKQINEVHGHLVGDEVLRRAGHALRHAMRPYDLAARYGGDEFALLAIDADEGAATDVATRALERLGAAIAELLPEGGTAATAGVAQWTPEASPTELVARADRALLYAKHEGFRGGAHTFAAVPEHFRPGRFAREDRGLPEPPPMPLSREWPESRLDERLRKRSRQLALANQLGARVAALTRADEILAATVEELSVSLGYHHASPIRLNPDGTVESVKVRWSQPAEAGLIGRCLRTRRAVLANDVRAEPDYVATADTQEVLSELVVPLWCGDELFGVLDVEEPRLDAFDQDDVALLEMVATQVGSALRGALLYERLERAYLGTAEALAAALEAKDAYTADHAASIVAQAEAVARSMGLDADAMRDLRFAAVFHDIGKIAIPEAILHKPGPLDDSEREVMERHTIVGEQILAPVEFLTAVRRLVRHEHERWDGAGYPDGLAGEEIPLGSRIILVCDALHAMTSDRPYRKAMSLKRAVAELRRHAGTQFDPAVVEALLDVLADEGLV